MTHTFSKEEEVHGPAVMVNSSVGILALRTGDAGRQRPSVSKATAQTSDSVTRLTTFLARGIARIITL